MRKASGKRLPHGATGDLVLAALWNIHMRTGRPQPVSRSELVQAVSLPETTVDDRLHVLVKQGRLMKLGRGLYTPTRQKDEEIFDRYWRHRPSPNWAPSPKEETDQVSHGPKKPGDRRALIFPEGVVMVERWFTVAEYARLESRRQRLAHPWLPDAGDDDEDI